MITDAIIITFSICLFGYLGLRDVLLSFYHSLVKSEIFIFAKIREMVSCSKCLTFWVVLSYSIANGVVIIDCILLSFSCALLALWIELLLAYINKIYNKLWEGL